MGWIWSLVRCEMIKNVIKKMFHLISWLAPILSNDIIPISWQGGYKKRMSVPVIYYKRDPLTWRPYSHNLGSASSRALSWSQWHSTMEDLNLLKKFWKWCMCCKINGRAGGCRVGGCDSRPGIVGWFIDPPKNVSPKIILVSLNELGSRKGTFSKKCFRGVNFKL